MPTWFWLNVPLMVLVFALTVGIPARMVLRDRVEQAPPRLAATAYINRDERDDKFVSV